MQKIVKKKQKKKQQKTDNMKRVATFTLPFGQKTDDVDTLSILMDVGRIEDFDIYCDMQSLFLLKDLELLW